MGVREVLEGLMYGLDTPGAYTRGLLAGRPGERVSGQEMLGEWGMESPNPVLGILSEMTFDPLNLIPGAALAKMGKTAAKVFRGNKALRQATSMPPRAHVLPGELVPDFLEINRSRRPGQVTGSRYAEAGWTLPKEVQERFREETGEWIPRNITGMAPEGMELPSRYNRSPIEGVPGLEQPPPLGSEDMLYHASPFAKEIEQTGRIMAGPDPRVPGYKSDVGLGGAGDYSASMTESLPAAQNIAKEQRRFFGITRLAEQGGDVEGMLKTIAKEDAAELGIPVKELASTERRAVKIWRDQQKLNKSRPGATVNDAADMYRTYLRNRDGKVHELVEGSARIGDPDINPDLAAYIGDPVYQEDPLELIPPPTLQEPVYKVDPSFMTTPTAGQIPDPSNVSIFGVPRGDIPAEVMRAGDLFQGEVQALGDVPLMNATIMDELGGSRPYQVPYEQYPRGMSPLAAALLGYNVPNLMERGDRYAQLPRR